MLKFILLAFVVMVMWNAKYAESQNETCQDKQRNERTLGEKYAFDCDLQLECTINGETAISMCSRKTVDPNCTNHQNPKKSSTNIYTPKFCCDIVICHTCPEGRFGADPACPGVCQCQKERTCNIVDGRCPVGDTCKPGYTGPTCQNPCPLGFWGPQCLASCNCLSKTELCNRTSGYCTSGCGKGYTGVACQQKCKDGFYGVDCKRECNCLNNTNEVCDKINGACRLGCPKFYKGRACDVFDCDNLKFGKDCKFECNCQNSSEQCNSITGECQSGCRDGLQPPFCNEPCANMTFGPNCSYKCHCKNPIEPCYKSAGTCYSDCADGYIGDTCQERIQKQISCDLTFGRNCSQQCHCVNVSEQCFVTDGRCTSGCAYGFEGAKCQHPVTEIEMWIIVVGVVAPVIVIILLVLLIIFIVRKCKNKSGVGRVLKYYTSSKPRKQNNEKPEDKHNGKKEKTKLPSIASVLKKDSSVKGKNPKTHEEGQFELKSPIQETETTAYEEVSEVKAAVDDNGYLVVQGEYADLNDETATKVVESVALNIDTDGNKTTASNDVAEITTNPDNTVTPATLDQNTDNDQYINTEIVEQFKEENEKERYEKSKEFKSQQSFENKMLYENTDVNNPTTDQLYENV